MKLVKLLTVAMLAVGLLVGTTFAADTCPSQCPADAAAKKKQCCVDAKKAGKACEKCPKKDAKK